MILNALPELLVPVFTRSIKMSFNFKPCFHSGDSFSFGDASLEFPERNLTEWFQALEDLLSNICVSKEKADEVSCLIVSLKIKQEKYNKLRIVRELTPSTIRKNVIEKYCISNVNHECDSGAQVLFGLSKDISYDQMPHEENLTLLEDTQNYACRGSSLPYKDCSSMQFPTKHLVMKMKMLNLIVSLYKENCSTIECIQQCREFAEKLINAMLQKQETINKTVAMYQKAISLLSINAKLLNYRIVKDYYSEDKGVAVASYKLNEVIINKIENLESNVEELETKMESFKKLEGTNFDLLLEDYTSVCEAIAAKEWTLRNMM